jgi:hypothetical protein
MKVINPSVGEVEYWLSIAPEFPELLVSKELIASRFRTSSIGKHLYATFQSELCHGTSKIASKWQ